MTTTAPKPTFVNQKWNFRVSIQGIQVGYFTKASMLGQEIELNPHHVGGEVDPLFYSPAKRTTDPMTLEKGSTDNDELWTWWQQHGDVEGAGLDVEELQREVTVELLARDKVTVRKTWVLGKSVLKRFEAGEFDGASSEDVIEKVIIQPVTLDKR